MDEEKNEVVIGNHYCINEDKIQHLLSECKADDIMYLR